MRQALLSQMGQRTEVERYQKRNAREIKMSVMKMHYTLLSNKGRRQGYFDPGMALEEGCIEKDLKEWEI